MIEAKELKTCTEKNKNKSYHNQRTLESLARPILENGNVNKISFEMESKEVNPCVLR